jgi:hypothetical protein
MAKINELDKEEFRLIARKLVPHWSDEDFEREWAAFVRFKQAKALH